jgi:hypothetical protein
MDKWDEMVSRVKNGILAEEPDAVVAGSLQLFAEFGRTLEQMGADLDRIATTLERAFEPGVEPAKEPPTLDL